MRDILLTLAVLAILPKAFRYTWVAVLLWTWFSIMNPHRLTYGFAYSLPFAALAAVAAFVSLFPSRRENHFPSDPAVITLIVFSLWMCITTFFALLPEGSLPDLDRAMKIMLMTLIAMASIRERKHIELFIWVNALSLGFYGFKGGLFTILSGGSSRVWGPGGSFVEGNNEIGLALIMTIPLLNYLRMVSPHVWVRRGLLATMLLSAAAALGTQSRGAFLAFLAMGMVMWVRSTKKFWMGVLIFVAGVSLIAFMPASWEQRMRTIETYQADGSAQGRITAWTTAVNIANDRVTGGGFLVEKRQIWDKYSPHPEWVLTAHSIYFQAIGEQGWIGFLLFISLGGFGFVYASQIRGRAKQRAESMWLYELAGMLQVSMVGYAVGGAFLSLTYYDLPYNLLVAVVACKYWLKEERWKTETVGAFGATVPKGSRVPVPSPQAA